MNLQYIEKALEQVFHVAFDVIEKKGGFVVSPEGSDKSQFEIDVFIKPGVRLTLNAKPERHGAAFLHLLNKSNKQKRTIFSQLIKTNTKGTVEIVINNKIIDENDFVDNSEKWDNFEIKFTEVGFDDTQEEVARSCTLLCSMILSLVDYSIEGFEEGNKQVVISTQYERNPINRQICLAAKGYRCSVCGVLLKDVYGEIADKVIEVHHSIPVSEMEAGHVVDPIKELFPLCPNCHTIIHKKQPPYTIDELKEIIKNNKS